MEKNVIEKFREFWESLLEPERHDLWDLLTALRDNDEPHHEEYKNLTTARLRYVLLEEQGRGVWWGKKLTKKEQKEAVNYLRKTNSHFAHHFLNAIEVLINYDIKEAKDLITMWEE